MQNGPIAGLGSQSPKEKASGLLRSHVPGRTDRLPIGVSANSYVIPADIVSGLGQGNTMSGAHLLDNMFGDMKPKKGMAKGGTAPSVPIIAAGGEYIVHPDIVTHIGGGDYRKGHRLLDQMVKNVRNATIRTLKKLPSPKK